MKFELRKIDCKVREAIPNENETILSDYPIDKVIPSIKEFSVYFREKKACPFNRGNWIIDIVINTSEGEKFYCIKLPSEMTEDSVKKYVEPLTILLQDYQKQKLH